MVQRLSPQLRPFAPHRDCLAPLFVHNHTTYLHIVERPWPTYEAVSLVPGPHHHHQHSQRITQSTTLRLKQEPRTREQVNKQAHRIKNTPQWTCLG